MDKQWEELTENMQLIRNSHKSDSGNTRDYAFPLKPEEIPDDDQMYNEIQGIETVPRLDGKVQLESKKQLKKRLGFSPNRFDSLCLSFAINVTKKAWYSNTSSGNMYVTDYDTTKL